MLLTNPINAELVSPKAHGLSELVLKPYIDVSWNLHLEELEAYQARTAFGLAKRSLQPLKSQALSPLNSALHQELQVYKQYLCWGLKCGSSTYFGLFGAPGSAKP